jgi:hypothetical protein
MKRSPKYIIEEQDKTIKKIKNQILTYASKNNEAFDFPSGKIKTKTGDKRNLLDRFMVDFRLQGTPKTRLMWLLSTAMKELIEEGKMFKRRNTREYKRQRGSVLYFTTMFAYADSEDKLKTISEKLGELANSYYKEKFISDTICSNPESLIGKEVIIDKNGIEENYTYRVRVRDGVRECRKIDSMNWEKIENIIDLDKSKELKEEVTNMEDMKELEKKPIKEYAIFDNMLNTIALLNMKGFEKFQILTVEGGYSNDGSLSDRDLLNNKVKIGDKILGMDFVITVLE